MPDPTVVDMMQASNQDAVDFARERFKVNLDFSENSIEHVEKILAQLHSSLPKKSSAKGPSQEQIERMAKLWGGYIGEVIRRRWGGDWTTETAAQPGTVITLRVSNADIFPPAKVYKRIMNGPEDNVWHYYQVLSKDFAAEK